MGWPMGWTDPDAELVTLPGPVMGRGPEQHAWEPPRMVAPRSLAGRPGRIKACGNGIAGGVGTVAARRVREVLKGHARGRDQVELFGRVASPVLTD